MSIKSIRNSKIKDKKSVAVVIPVYKSILSENELFSIQKTLRVLKDRDAYFIGPESLPISYYVDIFSKIDRSHSKTDFKLFSNSYFQGKNSYSKLLTKIQFYKEFEDYKYILIFQPDALIMSETDELDYFISKGFDYLGAPWPNLILFRRWKLICGNGGASLRNVSSTISFLKRKYIWVKLLNKKKIPEDCIFSFFGNNGLDKHFHCGDYESASQFAGEQEIEKMLINDNVPYCVHAWEEHLPSNYNIRDYFKNRIVLSHSE